MNIAFGIAPQNSPDKVKARLRILDLVFQHVTPTKKYPYSLFLRINFCFHDLCCYMHIGWKDFGTNTDKI